jgi:hypothetical protein
MYCNPRTGLSVVGLVRHSLLECAASLDVDDVSGLVALEVGGQVLDALVLVGAGKHVAGAAAVTGGIHHLQAGKEQRPEQEEQKT